MAVGSYYKRVLAQAFSETNKKRAFHWWLGVIVGGPGGVAFLAWLRWRRGESTLVEFSPDAFIAAIGGATLAWVATFVYQLVLAPVELEAIKNADIDKLEQEKSERNARIADLEAAHAAPTLTAPQRQRVAEVAEIFGGCSRDALNILNRVASGPHPTYAAKKASGAEEFHACTEKAFERGILRVEIDNRRGQFYVIGDKWKEAVEHFLNEHLD